MRISLRRYKRGGTAIYQPVIPVTVEIPLIGKKDVDALLDTGSDTTYFSTSAKLPSQTVQIGSATGHPIPAAHIKAHLTIEQGSTKYSWHARVLFTNHEVRSVLGYIGFLEYFTIILDTKKKEVVLKPNGNFPGTVNNLWG